MSERRLKRSPREWRLGGRSARLWDASVFSVCLGALGVGLTSSLGLKLVASSWAGTLSLLTLWLCLGAAIAFALRRTRPKALLQFRPTDILWGVGMGLLLRVTQGIFSGANASPFPSVQVGGDGVAPPGTFLSLALPAVAAPLIEEFFFRAVLLVTIFQILRRPVGVISAAITALIGSSGAFLLLHAMYAPLSPLDSAQLFLVGVGCGLVVMLTGRIWGAVLTHFVYNLTFLALILVGTILG